MTIILFLVVLAVLILVHELGHFLLAKYYGVAVDEFGLGFPPRLFFVRWHETIYSLNLIPFGGFVKLRGEDGGDDLDPRSLGAKRRYHQAVIMAAGVAANILLAWGLLSTALYLGLPASLSTAPPGATIEAPALLVTHVKDASPAAAAGLKPGDKIIRLERGKEQLVPTTAAAAVDFIKAVEQPVTIIVAPRGEQGERAVTVKPEVGLLSPGEPAIGLGLDVIGLVKVSLPEAISEGASFTGRIVIATVSGLVQLLGDAIGGEENLLASLVGPVGLAGLVGDASDFGFTYLLSFVAFISINLAIFNLIPLPALDGGRLVILAIEGIRRSPLPARLVGWLNLVGFLAIVALMLIITVADLIRLF